MRTAWRLALLLALAALLSGPLAAAQPVERVQVHEDYPLPFVHASLYEDSACATHELFWQGVWFTAADTSLWAWHRAQALQAGNASTWLSGSASSAQALEARPLGALNGLVTHGLTVDRDGETQAPRWLNGSALASDWALAQVGNEDVCLLSLGYVATGL